jgi:deoxyribonuclease-4
MICVKYDCDHHSKIVFQALKMSMRIREILDALKGNGRKPLLKYIPRPTLPVETKGLFPNAILSALPYDQKYSLVGLVTEALVLSSEPITNDSIIAEFAKLNIVFDDVTKEKIKKSKTTADYIAKILKTRVLLKEKLMEVNESCCPIELGVELKHECIEGHPDGVCGKSVMEVKTTSKLEDDFNYFMLQLSAYAALGDGQFTQAILVLPLQQAVIAFDVRLWPKRKYYRDLLVSKVRMHIEAAPISSFETMFAASLLVTNYNIGNHVKKAPTLLETVKSLTPGTPFQIFMGGNQNTRLNIKDADIAAAAEYVDNNNIIVYIHSPYLINLSATAADNWHIEYMRRLLQYGATLGARGVVVHTGKHTSESYEVGVEKMRLAIQDIIEEATPGCPLLLESPAGQGSETLKDMCEFLDFVEGFKSPKLRACVDTCHVFACGHYPLEYVKAAHRRNLLHLVHYNDSKDVCGSCKDRHAMVGQGKIGLDTMTRIAQFCSENRIDMLIE